MTVFLSFAFRHYGLSAVYVMDNLKWKDVVKIITFATALNLLKTQVFGPEYVHSNHLA